jgi:hypothetical protein
MLKHLMVSSMATLLLVGCATSETQPLASSTPPTAAKVAPATLKPALKAKPVATKPTLVKPAIANADAALGKYWATCMADIVVLSDFSDQVMQRMQPFAEKKTLVTGQRAIKDLMTVAAIFQQYSIAALGEPMAKATFITRYREQMPLYIKDWQRLWLKVNVGNNKQTGQAVSEWSSAYMARVNQVVKAGESCEASLRANQARFTPKVTQNIVQLKASRN